MGALIPRLGARQTMVLRRKSLEPPMSQLGQTRLRRLRRGRGRTSFDSRLERARNSFGLGVTSLIEALGRCTFIPSFRSSIFQIGEPFALYSDALWRALTWSMPTLHARVAADHSDCATPLPMIVDRAKRRHTRGPMKLRRSCGPVPNPWDIHMPAMQAG
jgi:hypothetical protein